MNGKRAYIQAGSAAAVVSVFLLLVLIPLSGFADNSRYFDFACLYRRDPVNNTEALVSLNPQMLHIDPGTGALKAEVEIKIGARRRDNFSLVSERTVRELISPEGFNSGDPYSFRYYLDLPPGEYSMTFEVRDLVTGRIHYSEQDYDCKPDGQPFAFSDIFLIQKRAGDPAEYPVMSGAINALFKGELLEFSSGIYAPKGIPLTARAILYRRESARIGSRDDFAGLPVQRYSGIAQRTSAIRVQQSGAFFTGVFNIDSLQAGDYLLEVYLFDGETLVAEESRAFSLEWKDLRRVFGNLEESISMLKYIATGETIERMLAISEPESRISGFLEFWRQRSDDPGMAIREYYTRIFEADSRFAQITPSDTVPGWLSERGRIYCLYGRPSREESRQEAGMKYSAWLYEDWGLQFTFDPEGKLM